MFTTTNTELLDGLKDGANSRIWREFDGRYRPILFAFARRLGLDAGEAAEVAQATLGDFAMEYREGRYERDRGQLRSWLFSMVRSRVSKHRRRQGREQGWRGESAILELPRDHPSECGLRRGAGVRQ